MRSISSCTKILLSMSKINFFSIIFFFPLICFAQIPDFSQTDSIHKSLPKKPFIIQTNDGEEFIGVIEEMNDREVTIITNDKGRVIIPKYNIKKMEAVTEDNYKSGTHIGENNFADKYIFENNSLPMEKQKIYVHSLYIFFWSANYAFNEKFSLGITGIFFLSLMLDSKVSIKINKQTYFGPEAHIGYLWFSPIYFGYGNFKLTTGTKQNNFTIAIGMAGLMDNSNSIYKNRTATYYSIYTANFGGMKRTGKNIAMTGELWALFNYANKKPIYVGGIGFKTLKSEKHSFTFALMAVVLPEQKSYYGFPKNNYKITYQGFPLPIITYNLKL